MHTAQQRKLEEPLDSAAAAAAAARSAVCTCHPEDFADEDIAGGVGAGGARGRQGVGPAHAQGAQLHTPLAGAVDGAAGAADAIETAVSSRGRLPEYVSWHVSRRHEQAQGRPGKHRWRRSGAGPHLAMTFGAGGGGGGASGGAACAASSRLPFLAAVAGTGAVRTTLTSVPGGPNPTTVPSGPRCRTMLSTYRPCSRNLMASGGGGSGGGGGSSPCCSGGRGEAAAVAAASSSNKAAKCMFQPHILPSIAAQGDRLPPQVLVRHCSLDECWHASRFALKAPAWCLHRIDDVAASAATQPRRRADACRYDVTLTYNPG